MSVLTTLALMTTVFAKKIREIEPRSSDVEITTLKARVDNLDGQIKDLENRIADLNHDLASMGIEADRWRDLANSWQARWERVMDPGAARERQAILLAQAQMQALMAQANSQMAQQAQQNQNYQQGQLVGMLGNQALALNQGFCNCVPARHDMFLGS